MTKHAIFIEPTGALLTRIVERKDRIRVTWPGAPYCDHPPHSTILIAPLRDPAAALTCLSASLPLPPFTLRVGEPLVFYDDVFTSGHTLAWRIQANPALQSLQNTVAHLLEPLVDTSLLPPLAPAMSGEPFLSSYRRFGFPFVGSHWMPHFTIASLPAGRNHPDITDFLSRVESFEQPVHEVSLWRVTDEIHTRLQTIKLEGHPCRAK